MQEPFCYAKINCVNFINVLVKANQEILWFNVSMYEASEVYQLQAMNLSHVNRAQILQVGRQLTQLT